MLISVIVPAYNAENTLPACLEALRAQTRPPDEVIVVDDGSTDRTSEVAERYPVKLLRQPNQGPASARNLGAQHARGDLLLFTDSDCEPWPDWVEHLSRLFADPDVVGAKGVYRTRQRSLVARFVQQEYESKYIRMAGQRQIDFIDTYSAAYRRDVFEANHGFDPAFLKLEDQELSFRLARKGYRMVFEPGAIVYHLHNPTTSRYVARKFGIGYWKAAVLRWLPEKTFGDSHTLPSQQWQIVLLGLAVLSAVGALLFTPAAWAIAVMCLGLFFVTAGSFLVQLWKRDRPVLLAAPFLLLCRSAALGAGLAVGLIAPHAQRSRSTAGLSLANRPLKRALDLLLSALGLIPAVPVMLGAAIAIKLESPGPAFFVQERGGEGGRPFKMLKLRTMVDGADDGLDVLLDANPLRGPVFKLPGDPRVTRVGRFLRRWSIDELPQLFNILRGEMSLVGPRPDQLRFVNRYDERQRRRLIVKPGLTGPAQVAGRGMLDFEQRLELELDYIEHYSLGRDAAILLRTVGAVLSGYGAY